MLEKEQRQSRKEEHMVLLYLLYLWNLVGYASCNISLPIVNYNTHFDLNKEKKSFFSHFFIRDQFSILIEVYFMYLWRCTLHLYLKLYFMYHVPCPIKAMPLRVHCPRSLSNFSSLFVFGYYLYYWTFSINFSVSKLRNQVIYMQYN